MKILAYQSRRIEITFSSTTITQIMTQQKVKVTITPIPGSHSPVPIEPSQLDLILNEMSKRYSGNPTEDSDEILNLDSKEKVKILKNKYCC